MDINQAKDVLVQTHLDALRDQSRAGSIYLESGPGIGKSSAGGYQYCRDLARATGKPVGLIIPNLVSWLSPDANGFMLPARNPEGRLDTVFSTPPWYPTRITLWVVEPDGAWHRPGTWQGAVPEVGVLFFDEFAQADEDVQKALSNVILEGRMRDLELPIGWRVMAAGNRTKDRSGVMRKMMHLVNRWCELYIDPSLPAFLYYMGTLSDSERPHHMTISFAKRYPEVVFQPEVPVDPKPFCTPRSLCMMDRDLRALRTDEDIAHDRMPTNMIASEVARGRIGEGAAAQLMGHYKLGDQLPDIEDILENPRTAKIPEGTDGQMVMAFFVAHHITEDSIGAIMRYVGRMNTEMQMMAVSAIKGDARRMKIAMDNQWFIDWNIKNQDLLIAAHS